MWVLLIVVGIGFKPVNSQILLGEMGRVTFGIDVDGNGIPDEREQDLAEKFCPALVLHSGDRGVSPEPVEMMNVQLSSAFTTKYGINASDYFYVRDLAPEDFEMDEKKDKNPIFLPLAQVTAGCLAAIPGSWLGGIIALSTLHTPAGEYEKFLCGAMIGSFTFGTGTVYGVGKIGKNRGSIIGTLIGGTISTILVFRVDPLLFLSLPPYCLGLGIIPIGATIGYYLPLW